MSPPGQRSLEHGRLSIRTGHSSPGPTGSTSISLLLVSVPLPHVTEQSLQSPYSVTLQSTGIGHYHCLKFTMRVTSPGQGSLEHGSVLFRGRQSFPEGRGDTASLSQVSVPFPQLTEHSLRRTQSVNSQIT